MRPQIQVDEQCMTVSDVAERLNLNADTVRRLFRNEPGVIVVSCARKGRRAYRTLRIPPSVYQRVLIRLTQ